MKKNSSFVIFKHESKETINKLISLIESYGINDLKSLNMDLKDYRELATKVQDKINEQEYSKKIVSEIKEDLFLYMNTQSFLIQSNVYFRCSRPNKKNISQSSESIGFHRESFYGPNMEKSINIWTPVLGVNNENTLRFIPNSHLIPDEEILTERKEDKFTKKFSDGHKLGFQYASKKIVSGVDLNSNIPMIVPYFSSSIFSGNLIHGAAKNYSNSIRFSCDFRVIRKSDYNTENKKFHFASGKPYFIDYDVV